MADWVAAWFAGRDVAPDGWVVVVGGRPAAFGLGVPRGVGSDSVWSSMLFMWAMGSVRPAARHFSISEGVAIALQLLWPLRGLC